VRNHKHLDEILCKGFASTPREIKDTLGNLSKQLDKLDGSPTSARRMWTP
jgi:hypothetical protein